MGLNQQHRCFVECPYVPISLPVSQRSLGSLVGDLRPAHPARQARRASPRKWPTRKILNAIFYLLRSGCQWRMLPREFPPWSTVYDYFRMWRKEKALGRRSMPRCAKGYAQAQGAIPNRAPPSSTPNR
jgi:transposase